MDDGTVSNVVTVTIVLGTLRGEIDLEDSVALTGHPPTGRAESWARRRGSPGAASTKTASAATHRNDSLHPIRIRGS